MFLIHVIPDKMFIYFIHVRISGSLLKICIIKQYILFLKRTLYYDNLQVFYVSPR